MHREASDGDCAPSTPDTGAAGSNSRNKVAKNVAWLGQGWVCWIVHAYKGLFLMVNGTHDDFGPGLEVPLSSETIMMGEFVGNE